MELVPVPAWRGAEVPVEIGRGRTARVYVEYDAGLGRHVAVKRLDPGLATDPFQRRALAEEARITARLVHPNIPRLYRIATDGGGAPYLTLELVEGISLTRWLSVVQPPGSAERTRAGVRLLLQICDAAAHAHERGVLHLDVKPDNVMVTERGRAFLLDWSVARCALSRARRRARSAEVVRGAVGTPGYLAPEQARGDPEELSERSDVFGLGALLYELSTAKTPYGAPGPEELLRRARLGGVVRVEEAARGLGVPARLLEIMRRATAPSPGDRYATARELGFDLRAFERAGQPSS